MTAAADSVGFGAVGFVDTYRAAVTGIADDVPTAAVNVAFDVLIIVAATVDASVSSVVTAKSTMREPSVSFWIDTRLFDTLSIFAMSVVMASVRRT